MIFKKINLFLLYISNKLYWKHLLYKIFYKFIYYNKLSETEIIKIIKSRYKVYRDSDLLENELNIKYFQFDFNKFNIDKSHISNFNKQGVGGGANLNLLFSIIYKSNIHNILETGVAFGWSSFSILAAIKNKNNSKLVSIDLPYPGIKNFGYIGSVVPKKLKKKWFLNIASDRSVLKKILVDQNFDLIHYDSDKTYHGRMWAYNILWNNLRMGGFFISDDISDNKAFIDFVDKFNLNPYIILFKNKYIGLIIKK